MALTKVIGNGLGATQEGAITFNEGSADVDFRVESNGNANMLFVDGGNNRVGVGTATPLKSLHIQAGEPDIFLRRTDLTNKAWLLNVQSSTGDLNIKSRNDDASASTTSMVIAHNGYVTKPLQPAFMAHPGGTAQNNVANADVIAFGTERFDLGGDFASNTFTAPVTGKYHFDINLNFNGFDQDFTYVWMFLNTSNSDYYIHLIQGNMADDDGYMNFGGSLLVDMDASDTAKVKLQIAGGAAQMDIITQTSSSFSGYLVA